MGPLHMKFRVIVSTALNSTQIFSLCNVHSGSSKDAIVGMPGCTATVSWIIMIIYF